MAKKLAWLLGLLAFLLWSNAAVAQGPQPQHMDPFWTAAYWNNKFLRGEPALQRGDAAIDFDWGDGSPAPQIQPDEFSARWLRYMDVTAAATFRFSATSDDGVRLFVDDELILDDWSDHSTRTRFAEKYLPPGHHLLKVEYYENVYNAVAKVSWTPNTPPFFNNWRGEYFNNRDLSGAPAMVRDDRVIGFHWDGDNGSPEPGIVNADNFSARWTHTLDLPAGSYRFRVSVDDDARLWVNGHLLIDAWFDQPVHIYTSDIYVPSGGVPIKLEFYEHTGGAHITLSWALAGGIANWRGEYYNNDWLGGAPALVRDDANVFFNLGRGSPAPGVINADYFSARWTRLLDLPGSTYRFWATSGDGIRVWVNNTLVIDGWYEHPAQTFGSQIDLPGGGVPVRVEYYERTADAVAQISWERAEPPVPDTLIVDDGSTGSRRAVGTPAGVGLTAAGAWGYYGRTTRTAYAPVTIGRTGIRTCHPARTKYLCTYQRTSAQARWRAIGFPMLLDCRCAS